MKLASTPVLVLAVSSLLLVKNASAFSTSRKILEVQQQQFADSLMSHSYSGLPHQQSQSQSQSQPSSPAFVLRSSVVLSHAPSSTTTTAAPTGFIDTELRGAAMRLHTKAQAPKEGQVEVKKEETPKKQYVPTHADYLHFLVDSQHVYQALEEIVNANDQLAVFRHTGLERTAALETDIRFLMDEYELERPSVGAKGTAYATLLREIAARDAVPEFMCHYYNYYFAHTAGGRMIGKQMSALLLNKKTLEFYKVRETYSVLFVCGFVWVVWTVRWDLGVEYVSFIILCIANLFLFSLFDSLYRIIPLRTCTDLINRQLTNGNTT